MTSNGAADLPKLNDKEWIRAWVKNRISSYASLQLSDIDDDSSIEEFGIDSAGAVTIAFDIEEMLAVNAQIEPEVLFENNTVNKLTDYIFSKAN